MHETYIILKIIVTSIKINKKENYFLKRREKIVLNILISKLVVCLIEGMLIL